jgi:uncharacterized protein with PhoU and TrkA domain
MSLTEIERILADLIDTTEMMIELAYTSLIYNNSDIAAEVVEMEKQVDKHHLKLELEALRLKHRRPDEKMILGLIRLGLICEMLSDAAASIADVVLRGLKADEILKTAIEEAEDTVLMKKVEKGSPLSGRSIGDTKLDDRFNVKVLAIKRGRAWRYEPSNVIVMEPGSVIIASGAKDSVEAVNELCQKPMPTETEQT